MWTADANKDIGFRFTLRQDFPGDDGGNHALREFNLERCDKARLRVDEEVLEGQHQEANPGPGGQEVVAEKDRFISGQNSDSKVRNMPGRCRGSQELVQCKQCDQQMQRRNYSAHLRRVHKQVPNLSKCENCKVRTLSVFPHVCKVRPARFPSPYPQQGGGLVEGEIRTCGTCGYKSSNVKRLTSHILLMHSGKEKYLQQHYNLSPKDSVKKEYSCQFGGEACGKKFKSKATLWKHLCWRHGVVAEDEINKAALGTEGESSKASSFERESSPTMTELSENVKRMDRVSIALATPPLQEVSRDFRQSKRFPFLTILVLFLSKATLSIALLVGGNVTQSDE